MSIFSALRYNGPIRVMFNNMPEGSRSSALREKVQLLRVIQRAHKVNGGD